MVSVDSVDYKVIQVIQVLMVQVVYQDSVVLTAHQVLVDIAVRLVQAVLAAIQV